MANSEERFRDELEGGVNSEPDIANYDSGLGDKLNELNPEMKDLIQEDPKNIYSLFEQAYSEYTSEEMQDFIDVDEETLKAIEEEQFKEILEKDQKEKEAQEEATKEAQEEGKEKVEEKQKDKKLKESQIMDIGYLDKVKLLHEMKMKLEEQRIKIGRIDYDSELYKNYLLLKKEMELDRDKYFDDLDDKQKEEFVGLEENNFKKERAAEKVSMLRLRKDMQKFFEYNKTLKELRDTKEYIDKEFVAGHISQEDYDKRNKKIDEDKAKTIYAIKGLNPEELKRQRDKYREQKVLETEILGPELMEKMNERMPEEQKEAIENDKDKMKESFYKIGNEEQYTITALKKDLETRKLNREVLIAKYEKTDNLEEKVELQKSIQAEDVRINGDEEILEGLAKGIEDPEYTEKINEEKEAKLEQVEEEYEDLEADAKSLEEVSEDQGNNTHKENSDDYIVPVAVGMAVAGSGLSQDEGEGTTAPSQEDITKGVVAGVVTHGVLKDAPDPLNLKEKVNNLENKKEAEDYIKACEVQEKVAEKEKELD